MKTGIELIAEERHRQVEEEGWTAEHDCKHYDQSLLGAAICYLETTLVGVSRATYNWPWFADSFKPSTDIRNLTKAAALIAAEIDRLQALSETSTKSASAPLKSFAEQVERIENPKGEFQMDNNVFKVGNRVTGTWVDHDGRTYHQEGVIVSYEPTGLWIQSEPDGGITEIKRFWTLQHIDAPPLPDAPPKSNGIQRG